VPQAHPQTANDGNEEATMQNLWGPAVDAELHYRRAQLGRLGTSPARRRRARRTVGVAGGSRPRNP
jgi:hypothetical protein